MELDNRWPSPLSFIFFCYNLCHDLIIETLCNYTNQKFSGLEPAAVLYEKNHLKEHLTENDAFLVDIVHSDAGRFGWSKPVGDIDFWPNGGNAVQPYCQVRNDKTPRCSHYTSVYYFAESVNNPDHFPAVRCQSREYWKMKKCFWKTTYFGFNIDDK